MKFIDKKLLASHFKNNPYFSIRFMYLVIATIFTLTLFSINLATGRSEVLSSQTSNQDYLVYQMKYWQNFLYSNPNYIDGWLELSLTEAKLGQKDEAVNSINRALKIDPNSSRAMEILKIINPVE